MAIPKEWLTDEENYIFTILNEEMLERLRREGKIKLPKKKIKIPKDEQWNMKIFNSELLEGILRGESVEDIAKRIFPEIMDKTNLFGHKVQDIDNIIRKNWISAIRNARTMVTGAENRGRLDSYKALDDEGVVQKKEWTATPDDRTRPSHIDIDGEEQDIDKPFSNGCMYPGDSDGPPEEVWQCRCSMTDRIVGFRRRDGSISYVQGGRKETTHEPQMRAERQRRGR